MDLGPIIHLIDKSKLEFFSNCIDVIGLIVVELLFTLLLRTPDFSVVFFLVFPIYLLVRAVD